MGLCLELLLLDEFPLSSHLSWYEHKTNNNICAFGRLEWRVPAQSNGSSVDFYRTLLQYRLALNHNEANKITRIDERPRSSLLD